MKNKIYFIILFSLACYSPNQLFSQSYKSIFGHTSTYWDVIIHGYCDFVVSKTVTATIDTNVNSLNYKVISGMGGFLREDTTQGKVWFYDTILQKEYLVTDMTLGLGDTSYIYSWNNDSVPMIVDSVYYEGGLKHLRFNSAINICGLNEKIEFKEGSGPNASFNYHGNFGVGEVNSYMLCHFKDNLKVLGNELFGDTCFVFSVGITEHKTEATKVKIFPNPATDFVSIDIVEPQNENFEVHIYNSIGALVKSENFEKAQQVYNINGLTNGIYFIEIACKEWIERQKIIINR
jgi:hypothetical protein